MAYLDHAATTPMLPEAVAAMTELLGGHGNPSSLHASGRAARRLVEQSRDTVARVLGAQPIEVVFTAGGTEADNIGLKGIAWSERRKNPAKRRIVVSSVEHHAVLDPAHWLAEQDGFSLTLIASDAVGRITPEALREALGDDPSDVAVVSVMLANNEVGTINDIAELTAVTREHGIRFHSDAVQAPAWLPVSFSTLGTCALSISGHKVGGPHGVGALIIDRNCDVTPLVHGGGQERDVRSGTIDTPAVVALAAALEIVDKIRDEQGARVTARRARYTCAQSGPGRSTWRRPRRALGRKCALHVSRLPWRFSADVARRRWCGMFSRKCV